MSDRPTVYASNFASWRTAGHHGPGRKISVMATPRKPYQFGDVCAPLLMPYEDDLVELRREQITEREYFLRLAVSLAGRWNEGQLAPGELGVADSAWWFRGRKFRLPDEGAALVQDGDSLLCVCARPGPKRTHRCHVELVAEYLVRAGWDVVLYGQRLTWFEPVYRCAACGNDLAIKVQAGRAACPECSTSWWVNRKGIHWADGARYRGVFVA